MQNNRDINDIVNTNFVLSVNVTIPDSIVKKQITSENWEQIKSDVLIHQNGICQGCGINPPDKNFLELHVDSKDANDSDKYKYVLLCKTCHTLQHIDIAAKKDWVRLVNSIFPQNKLIYICRSGAKNLNQKIKAQEIMILSQEPEKYAELLKEDDLNKREKIKAIFGKNFPQDRLI